MIKRVDKQKAKEILPKLLDMVSKGLGPIEICDQKKDKTLAYLVAPSDFKTKSGNKKKSYLGFLKGKLEIPKDFDEPAWDLIEQIEKSQ